MSQLPRFLVKRKQQTTPGSISPSERQDRQIFDRSLLEEVMEKMERTEAKKEITTNIKGKIETKTVPVSQSHRLAKDIILAITPTLGLGNKAGLIKENIFGLQDMAVLSALNELHNGPDDISVKGMNLITQNTTLSIYPRAVKDELRHVNIIQKEDPLREIFVRYMMGGQGGGNIATHLEQKEDEAG